jgi:DNA topoisomerase-1
MATKLVIVESPAKAKTINKYLGPDYKVMASYGHIRDLVASKGAVDPEHNFAMKYTLIDKNKKHVDAIIKALGSASTLILATDPDREGEAISWHLQEYLKEIGALTQKKVCRVTFFEITKKAVQQAMEEPRDLSMDLVDAQQARRALDYLVGFNLSPLLWKKVRRGLSAGRVQSPALRLIVERELEIEAFKQQEYWSIKAGLEKQSIGFVAKLNEWKGKKLETLSISSGNEASQIESFLNDHLKGSLTVSNTQKKQRKRQPSAPFTTSTLQQEAARKLGFSAKKTMMIAQQLYEGVDIGEGTEGLITYMRTDSMNLSPDFVNELRAHIQSHYGKDYLPDSARFYKTKAKNAQEAHEAIRPTAIRLPDAIRTKLEPDQYKLYQLIFKRTVACQMIHANMEVVTVDFACEDQANFHATGSTVLHPGFMKVYSESVDDRTVDDDDEERVLPPLSIGDQVKVNEIIKTQHFTEPPPRYTEASLVKTLEEFGIGRPSTYAAIISTLTAREYAILESKRFKPTDIGRIVNKFLTDYFNQYVDYGFTANLEDELDEVSRGEKPWVPVLESFWKPFIERVTVTDKDVKRSDVTSETLEENCPKCGKTLTLRLGKSGRFIGCSGYPECDYTRNTEHTGEEEETLKIPAEVVEGRVCPKCEKPLNIRQGRYGKFIGCSGYPKCKFIEPLIKPKTTNVRCPECQEGDLIERKSRYGKVFYSCNRYPTCKFAVWNQPIAEKCPSCGLSILTLKTTKRYGTQKVCPHKTCGYTIGAPELAPQTDSGQPS